MSLNSSVIGYDFDGVICDTMPAFIQYWKEKYDWNIDDTNNREFEMPMPEDYDFKHIADDIVEAINIYQGYMLPHAYAIEMVREIGNRLNQVPIIITARRKANEEITRAWLNHWLNYPYDLVVVGGHRKNEVVAQQDEMKYFVEDRFRTVGQLAEVCEKVFMPRRIWNTGRNLTHDNIIPVNNLVDVYNILFSDSGESEG